MPENKSLYPLLFGGCALLAAGCPERHLGYRAHQGPDTSQLTFTQRSAQNISFYIPVEVNYESRLEPYSNLTWWDAGMAKGSYSILIASDGVGVFQGEARLGNLGGLSLRGAEIPSPDPETCRTEQLKMWPVYLDESDGQYNGNWVMVPAYCAGNDKIDPILVHSDETTQWVLRTTSSGDVGEEDVRWETYSWIQQGTKIARLGFRGQQGNLDGTLMVALDPIANQPFSSNVVDTGVPVRSGFSHLQYAGVEDGSIFVAGLLGPDRHLLNLWRIGIDIASTEARSEHLLSLPIANIPNDKCAFSEAAFALGDGHIIHVLVAIPATTTEIVVSEVPTQDPNVHMKVLRYPCGINDPAKEAFPGLIGWTDLRIEQIAIAAGSSSYILAFSLFDPHTLRVVSVILAIQDDIGKLHWMEVPTTATPVKLDLDRTGEQFCLTTSVETRSMDHNMGQIGPMGWNVVCADYDMWLNHPDQLGVIALDRAPTMVLAEQQ